MAKNTTSKFRRVKQTGKYSIVTYIPGNLLISIIKSPSKSERKRLTTLRKVGKKKIPPPPKKNKKPHNHQKTSIANCHSINGKLLNLAQNKNLFFQTESSPQ